MSGYGFGKKATAPTGTGDPTKLDLSGIVRAPLSVDPAREAAAIARGNALGFVDRGDSAEGPAEGQGATPVRRRRQPPPQSSLYIKGPKETLDWFIDFTNQRGHRSYWQALAEFRDLVEGMRGSVPEQR